MTRNALRIVSDYLTISSPPQHADLIFVLAGKPERKRFGLSLFEQGLAPRLILSVGRYEVQHTSALIAGAGELKTLARTTPPHGRHFIVDLQPGSCTVSRAPMKRSGTYAELKFLASYLHCCPSQTINMISTSIHLRRVQFCCNKIPLLAGAKIFFVPVPEKMSSFQRDLWWKRYSHWKYVFTEYVKLVGYCWRYRACGSNEVANQLCAK